MPPGADEHDVEPLPGWVAWVAWGAGAIALYVLLLGRVTLDALDGEYPSRDAIRAASNAGKPLPIEIGEEAEDNAEIRDALSVLPEMLTILADQRKGRIIITNVEAIQARGITPGLPVSHVAGYFEKDGWRLFIAHDAEKPGMVALHEYGHFVDAALDGCSETPAFDAINEAAVASGDLGTHYTSSPAEMFAYMFSQHFFSDRRRARLEADYPEGAKYMSELASTGACPQMANAPLSGEMPR